MLDKKTGKRVKQQYVSSEEKPRVVEKDDIVKGYEFAKNQYVRAYVRTDGTFVPGHWIRAVTDGRPTCKIVFCKARAHG